MESLTDIERAKNPDNSTSVATIKTAEKSTEEADWVRDSDKLKNSHLQSPAISELSVSLVGNSNAENDWKNYEIKSVRYFRFSLRFWQFFAIMVLGNYFGTFFSYSYKPFGENTSPHEQISDKTLTWAASIGAGLVNGLSRICFGTLVDKYSFKLLMSILMTI